uniref:Related to dock180 protein n=1 Tax=Neurospora crassa TaxID=5141 RepID=Q6MWN2_NEUCS|nr:related to dock180 protein [Neurospora crassa]
MPWQPLPRIAFAVATYPFTASSAADLPLEIGDELYIIEETPDGNWLRGYLTLEARVFSGIFPRSCVEVREIGDETPTSAAEPLIDEIASCLREWHSTNLHGLLLSRQYEKLDTLSKLITSLNLSRQQFLHNVLTTWEYDNLREKTVWDLVRVNKLCGGEVIVRDPNARGRPPTTTPELTALHHLMVDIKMFAGASNESTTLVLYLATKAPGGRVTPLSESYIVDVPAGGQLTNLARTSQMRTLFSDLSSADVGDVQSSKSELLLVVKIRAPQSVVAAKPSSRSGAPSNSSPQISAKESKPPLTSGNKALRRSMVWANKNTRGAFTRKNSDLEALSEQAEEQQTSNEALESRDGGPPSTANSNRAGRSSMDGQSPPTTADRTVGVGVLKLNSIMKQQGEEVEHVVNIWAPCSKFPSDRHGDSEEWDPLIKEICDIRSGHHERSRRAERLQIRLRSFNNPDADALIKMTPTVLSGICKTNKMGFSGAPTKPRSDIYVTIDEAILTRQTLLSRYGASATALPSSIHSTNLQITLEVRRANGERIDYCIYPSSKDEGLSTWRSTAVDRGDPWKQIVKLVLAPQDVHQSHIVMYLADAPNPPFAVAYLPLWDQQAFIHDGSHNLLLYKLDENTSNAQAPAGGKGGYLSLPFASNFRDEHAEVTGPLAVLRIDTYLCSTRFSQDKVVLGLLKGKDLPLEEVPDILKAFIFVPEIEVVKLLNDVLDALFGILVHYTGHDDLEDLVFTALVRVLDIVHDRRFNLAPLVDQYAETRFNYPFATPCLVRSFTRLLSKPTEPETSRKLRATFKVVRHILKFITHARGQQKEKEAGIGITTSNPGFTRHLRTIFKALDALMRNQAPVLVGSQTLAVQHFHTWLPELTGLLTTEEILHIAIDFMDSCSSVKGKLVLYKLVLIINYSKLDIFSHPEQRSALSANTVRWIAPHWGHTDEVTEQWREQVRLCCSVLASQVEHLGPEIPDYIPKIIQSYLAIQAAEKTPKNRLSLLFPTSYPFPAKPTAEEVVFDEALIELSAVLSALSNSPSGMQLELAEDDLNILVESCLRVLMSILQGETFPPNWLSVHIFHHKSTMRMLQYLATLLLESFLPHPDEAENFDTELWKMFFTTLLKLVGSPSLALETFPEQKRRAVWKIAGDVREHGADLLRKTWEAIGWETSLEERARYGLSKMGGYQVQYVPTLVGPIVELCLSVHEGLRRMAVEVLQTMIVSEWTLSEDLSVIQMEIIDCLDGYFKEKPLTESILQKLFVSELLDRFEPLSKIPDEPLYTAIRKLMGTVDEFLDLLVAVHGGDGSGETSDLVHRLRLMEFLRDMQKEEIFIRYVHQLASLQASSRNYTEAGLALRLHADLYDWDPLKTTPALDDPCFPAQSHFERKERIYFDMIRHFEDGHAWSCALAAYKELQAQYESNIFDFAKLARTQRAIATIYETIAHKTDKLIPKYFKVVYKGLGFPPSVRDKAFVFEGASPTERTAGFTDRMQEMYPSAQIITPSYDRDTAEYDVEGQFLIISAISPHRDLTHTVFQRARVPQIIRDYLISSSPQTFSVSTKRDTNGDVRDHYAEKTLYTTAEPFPTILKRSEIVEIKHVRLTAKETALERIVRKTGEMTAVEKKIAEGQAQGGEGSDEATVMLLVDAVSISVNPESEASVSRYRELIPGMGSTTPITIRCGSDEDEDEEDAPPEIDAQENAIKMALVDHAIMIKRCLATFAKSPREMTVFERTFAPEIAIFTPPPARAPHPSPGSERTGGITPSPTWPRSPGPSAFNSATGQHKHHLSATASLANGHGLGISSNAQGHAHTASETTDVLGEIVVSTGISQPVSLRQGRGARLSFLGGRRKDGNSPTAHQLSSTGSIPHLLNGSEHNLASRSKSHEDMHAGSASATVMNTPTTNGDRSPSAPSNVIQSRKEQQQQQTDNTQEGYGSIGKANRRSFLRGFSSSDKVHLINAINGVADSVGGNTDWQTEYSSPSISQPNLDSPLQSQSDQLDRERERGAAAAALNGVSVGGYGKKEKKSKKDKEDKEEDRDLKELKDKFHNGSASVKKRLSMLKLGNMKKSGKGDGKMGALDEE